MADVIWRGEERRERKTENRRGATQQTNGWMDKTTPQQSRFWAKQMLIKFQLQAIWEFDITLRYHLPSLLMYMINLELDLGAFDPHVFPDTPHDTLPNYFQHAGKVLKNFSITALSFCFYGVASHPCFSIVADLMFL